MIDMLKRHEIQVLRRAGHSQFEVADLAGVSRRTVQRVDVEAAVGDIDTARERQARGIGRPPKAEPFRTTVAEILAGEPELQSVEILRRAKLKGLSNGSLCLNGPWAASLADVLRVCMQTFTAAADQKMMGRKWRQP